MNQLGIATELIDKLRTGSLRLVLAESCTGGLAAARLTGVAGASEVFCGSMVTYQEGIKSLWLGVPTALLKQHSAVSKEVTEAMVVAVLNATQDASVAAAITGHLGPDAPAELDGVVFVALLHRESVALDGTLLQSPCCVQYHLKKSGRVERQQEAADVLLNLVNESLD
jgi:nicotinamide-nucleotide amidase